MFIWPMGATLKMVHRITTAHMISQGSQPCHMGMVLCSKWDFLDGPTPIAYAGSGTGCHTFRNSTVASRVASADSTSVSA